MAPSFFLAGGNRSSRAPATGVTASVNNAPMGQNLALMFLVDQADGDNFTYSEDNSFTLTEGAVDSDGDAVSVRRVNGNTVSGATVVNLPVGSVTITSGVPVFDTDTDSTALPAADVSVSNGSFTFTLWDGQDESPVYTASVELMGAPATTTAPAKADQVGISAETSNTFLVTLPNDPNDNGVAITRRTVSIMPRDEFLAGNFANAIYPNDFSANEARTINTAIYPAMANSLNHAVRWKAINGPAGSEMHGEYSDYVAAALTVTANAPTFTAQPVVFGGQVGNPVTFTLGSATGQNAVTLTPTLFEVAGVDQLANISGNSWDSTGSAAGLIRLQVTATDDVNGLTTLSNIVTASLTAAGSGPAQIKSSVESLMGTSGRKTGGNPVPVSAGGLPAGATNNGSAIVINQPNTAFDNWDTEGLQVVMAPGCSGSSVTNCKIHQLTPKTTFWDNLRVENGLDDILIADNDIAGLQGWDGDYAGSTIRGSRSLMFLSFYPAGGAPIIARGNMLKWCTNDFIKANGNFRIEENVLHSVSNVNMLPVTWSGGTHVVGDVVKLANDPAGIAKQYICIQDHTNQSPSSGTTTAFWGYYDPHTEDFALNGMNIGTGLAHRNLVLRSGADPLIPVADRSFGVGRNNVFQCVPNTGVTDAFGLITITENVLRGNADEDDFAHLIDASAKSSSSFTQPLLDQNIIKPIANGSHWRPTANLNFGTNYNYDDLAVI